LGDRGVNGSILLIWMLKKLCGKVWTWFIWFRIGANGWLSWTRIFGFHERLIISWATICSSRRALFNLIPSL
jgi:hypothetical protein